MRVTQQRDMKKYSRRYPWSAWFKRGRVVLKKGVDFNGRAYTMAQQIRNAASRRRHGVRVHIKISDDEESITLHVLGAARD